MRPFIFLFLGLTLTLQFTIAHAAGPDASTTSYSWQKAFLQDYPVLKDLLNTTYASRLEDGNTQLENWNQWSPKWMAKNLSKIQSAHHYQLAMFRMVSWFKEPHLSISAAMDLAKPRRLVNFKLRPGPNGRFLIAPANNHSGLPAGAQLESCDGRSAHELASTFDDYFYTLSSRLERAQVLAELMLADLDNPFVDLPVACKFSSLGKIAEIKLEFKDLKERDPNFSYSRVFHFSGNSPDFNITTADGITRINVPTLDLSADKLKQVTSAYVSYIQKNKQRILSGKAIAIDVRGNGGGTVNLAADILVALYGEEAADLLIRSASRGEQNLRTVSRYQLANAKSRVEAMREGDAKAYRTGLLYTVALEEELSSGVTFTSPSPISWDITSEVKLGMIETPPVVVVMDRVCTSSCLIFLDWLKQLHGTKFVGEESGSDTPFLEVQGFPLPSGLADVIVQSLYVRNRNRKAFVPYKPDVEIDFTSQNPHIDEAILKSIAIK